MLKLQHVVFKFPRPTFFRLFYFFNRGVVLHLLGSGTAEFNSIPVWMAMDPFVYPEMPN